jgi:hypothetical protein
MAFLKRRKKKEASAIQGEAAATTTARGRSSSSAPAADSPPREEITPEQNPRNPDQSQPHAQPDQIILEEIDDMLNPDLIGRTINLIRADDWEEDLIERPAKETQILYENQRGYVSLLIGS